MISGKKYVTVVKQFYSFLESEFGLKKGNETINGNVFYDVEFQNDDKIVSISYENIEDHLNVIVFILQNGKLPDYNDKTKTLHIELLNAQILSKVTKNEFNLNNEYFVNFKVKDGLQKRLLKLAKELRICLKYI
jgi:hypothetical protein